MLGDRWVILILVLHSVTYLYGLYSDEKTRLGKDYGSVHDIPRNIECNIAAVASICSDFRPEVRTQTFLCTVDMMLAHMVGNFISRLRYGAVKCYHEKRRYVVEGYE